VRGGYVRDVTFKDIEITEAAPHLWIYSTYAGNNDTPPAPDAPLIENIHVENVIGTGSGRTLVIDGLPGAPIRGVTVRNSRFNGGQNAVINHAENLDFTYSTTINGIVSQGQSGRVWDITNCNMDTIHGIWPQHIRRCSHRRLRSVCK